MTEIRDFILFYLHNSYYPHFEKDRLIDDFGVTSLKHLFVPIFVEHLADGVIDILD